MASAQGLFLVIAFTDMVVGLPLSNILLPSHVPDEQHSVIPACQVQPLKNGNTPTGNRFGQNYAKQAVHSNPTLLPWYVYFLCLSHFADCPIYINFPHARSDMWTIKIISAIMSEECAFLCRPVSHSFLLFIRMAGVLSSFPECVLLLLHTFSGSNNGPLVSGPS